MDDPLKDSFDDYIEKFKHPFWSMTLNEAFESHLALEAKLAALVEAANDVYAHACVSKFKTPGVLLAELKAAIAAAKVTP